VLAIGGLVGARVAGVRPASTIALFGIAAGLVVLARLTGRRRRVFWIEVAEAAEVDAGVHVLGALGTVVRAAFPSTVGLTILTAIALASNAQLAALLAGALGGLGIVAALLGAEILLWERSRGREIVLHGKGVYLKRP
jgi:hypothetical protein